jgi:SagB-type dehydrogenase family enzyme
MEGKIVSLPAADHTGSRPLEWALDRRHSCREFTSDPLTWSEVGQLLWAAQGVNAAGRRTAPSAGALYPLEVYAVTPDGVSHYDPVSHARLPHREGDLREALARAALGQHFVRQAPLTIVLTAVFARVTRRYGQARGERYVLLEVGHAAQNVLLQAVALGLGSVAVGAFEDAAVAALLGLPHDHVPLYLLPVGHPGE